MLKTTKITDPELYSIVEKELERQKYNIEMIASESSAPTEILELMGSVFVNKTEEGLPGKRYQAGSQYADEVENLCIKRVLYCLEVYSIFNCWMCLSYFGYIYVN